MNKNIQRFGSLLFLAILALLYLMPITGQRGGGKGKGKEPPRNPGTTAVIVPSTGGGNKVLLSSHTLTGESSVTFNPPGGYDLWEVWIMSATADSDGAGITLEVSSASTIQTANYRYHIRFFRSGLSSDSGAVATSAASLTALHGAVNFGIDATDGSAGCVLRIYGPDSTSAHKPVDMMCVSEGSSDEAVWTRGSGFWSGGTGALDGFRISASAGNLPTGTIALVGYNY